MKKICFIDYNMSIIGGVEKVTASLVNALADFYEVHLISLCKGEECPYSLDDRIHYVSLLKHRRSLRKMQRILKPQLAKYLNNNKIDIAVAQGIYPGFILSSCRFSVKTKLVFCDHGALMNQSDNKSAVFLRFVCSFLSHKTVTLTERTMLNYIQKLHTKSKKICCIYNWIDPEIAVSQKYDQTSHRIVSAGYFSREKGFELLVQAFASVAQKHPDWHLDIYGSGQTVPMVSYYINQLNISKNITLKGLHPNLTDYYKDYAMYVLPSYREGLPLVLLESKANRLPIVSFDIITGPREIVRDGIDGILVPPYDIDKLSEAICKLIEDEELRISMSNHSQENLSKFSKETILSLWKNLFDSL